MKNPFKKKPILIAGLLIGLGALIIGIQWANSKNTSIGGAEWPGEQIMEIVSPDHTSPTCSVSLVHPGKTMEITIHDDGDGLSLINVLRSDNASVWIQKNIILGDNSKVIIPPRIATQYIYDPLVLTVTKNDQSQSSQVVIEAFDMTGDRTECGSGIF